MVDSLVFNTGRPLFSSARLRRAVSYALDRHALAGQGLISDLPATPTDHYLPPGIPGLPRLPGYTPSHPTWRKLGGLPALSGEPLSSTRCSDPAHLRFAEIVKANLRHIGIDVRIRALGDSLFARLPRKGEPFDLAVTAWGSDYLDPMDILGQFDGRTIGPDHNTNLAYFNDPGFNRRLDAANTLSSPTRELALGRLDTELARSAAPWAAVANERQHDFFSARVGCQAYDPVYGIDLGALCISGNAGD